ncbi:hypothetical protein [Amycolatopsis sp. GA6-003]|uniref:hypothetical protein n=1 Tax=Amycolatopsis sp. GA6-003 TaxID=2652444 RepID=UPI003916D6E2
MGFFSILEDVGHWVGERIDDLGKFYSAVLQADTGAEALSAPELAHKVLAGPGTSDWHRGAGRAADLGEQHHEASDLVARMSTGLESAWTGRAADAAQTRIRALAEIASVSAAIYTTNGANLSDVAHGFDAMKTSLQPMPDQPPHLSFIDRSTPWDTDAEKEINHYNAVAQQNVDRYQAYVQHARTGSQQLQSDYGRLDDFGGRSDTVSSRLKSRQGPDEAPVFPKPRNSGHPPEGPPPTAAPPVSGPPVSGPPATQHGPGGTQGPSGKPSPDIAPQPRTDERTTVSGWAPDPAAATVAPRPGESGNSTSSPGLVGIPPQNKPGTAGATGGIAKGESNRAGEPRSRPGGPPPRPGKGTGLGEEGRAANPSARGTAGAPGSRGSPGIGGITPAQGKGKDEDREDHHRKYGLETDSAFTFDDDDGGERTVDPRTGLPPTPPTIGG